MSKFLRLAVYDSKDKLVMEGSVGECAKKIGVTPNAIRKSFERRRYARNKGYLILDISHETPCEKSEATMLGLQKAIADWDAVVTPLRERFGIPVYNGNKEEG